MKTLLPALIITLCIATIPHASAAAINGGAAVGASGSGAYTASSLTLSGTNIIESATGDLSADFGSIVPAYSGTLTGLSSTPTTENIADYFQFSEPFAALGATGTTPADRFSFQLTSLTETNSSPLGDFTGTGILTDTTGALAASNATFSLGFSGPGNYSFSLSTTTPASAPEPSTWALLSLSFGALVVFGMRRSRCA